MIDSGTSFEPPRGVTSVRLRRGLSHIRVDGLPRESIMPARLRALKALKDADVKIDFLKLTPDGFSCVIEQESVGTALAALSAAGGKVTESPRRALLSVHCVNIRDQAGIVARIVETVISAGAPVEQMGDSHDRILLVVEDDRASRAMSALASNFGLSEQAQHVAGDGS